MPELKGTVPLTHQSSRSTFVLAGITALLVAAGYVLVGRYLISTHDLPLRLVTRDAYRWALLSCSPPRRGRCCSIVVTGESVSPWRPAPWPIRSLSSLTSSLRSLTHSLANLEMQRTNTLPSLRSDGCSLLNDQSVAGSRAAHRHACSRMGYRPY
jgi:hypothetical protein